jgi:hypothetical protein
MQDLSATAGWSPDRVRIDQLLADESSLGWHHRAEAKGEHRPRDGSDGELDSSRRVVQGEVKQQRSTDHPDDRRLPLNLERAGVDVGINGADDA